MVQEDTNCTMPESIDIISCQEIRNDVRIQKKATTCDDQSKFVILEQIKGVCRCTTASV